MAKLRPTTRQRQQRRLDSIERGRARRVVSSERRLVRIEWFIDRVRREMSLTAHQRVKVATDLVRNQVVLNISRPVTKTVVTRVSWSRRRKAAPDDRLVAGRQRSYTRVTDRSKKGEYPKADTTQLMKTIFGEVRETSPDIFEGFVGTPLDYGLILEISERLDRSFLLRTFREEYPKIMLLLTAPTRRGRGRR